MLRKPDPGKQRHQFLVRRLHPDGRGHQLEWMQLETAAARGTVLAPPLVGGDGLLSIRYLKPLRGGGYNLLSFNYSGHGLSSRPFSIRQSLRDTQQLLTFARHHPRRFKPPLHGLGLCYAATPLLHALQQSGEPLSHIVLINAIPQLFSRNLLHSFWDFRRHLESEAWPPGHLGVQMRRYAEFLLPGITINRRQFGILALRRIRMLQTLVDWLASRHLEAVRLAHTAVLCLYSSEDRLFRAFRYFDNPQDYENAIRRICPTAVFVRLAGDHFLSPVQSRQQALTAIKGFFESHNPSRLSEIPLGARGLTGGMALGGRC